MRKLLVLPAWPLSWMLGIVTGVAPIAGYNVIRDWAWNHRGDLTYDNQALRDAIARGFEIADYAAYTLAGLALALVMYLTIKREWTPPKIAFALGLCTLPAMFAWALENF